MSMHCTMQRSTGTRARTIGIACWPALLSGSVAMALIAVPTCAWAQGAPSATAEPALEPQAEAQSGLGDIVVTAQRRSERLVNVPMAISVATAEAIERSGASGLHDLARLAPGVQVNFGGVNTQPAIRGITSLINGAGVENNVTLYVDGYYQPNGIAVNGDFANLASIEVLKGPQGALYGRNATGGALLFNTLAPTDTFTGKVQLTYARFDDRAATGYVSGPITPNIRFSLAGYYRRSDGYIKFSDPDRVGETAGNASPVKQQNVRAKLEADITDNLTATLGYTYFLADDFRGELFTTFEHVPRTVPAPPARATRFGTASYNNKTSALVYAHQGTLTLELESAIGTVTSRTGYSHLINRNLFDFDGTYVNSTYTISRYIEDTFQQSLDYNITAIDGLELAVGALYYYDKVKTDPDVGVQVRSNGVEAQRTRSELETEAMAVYVDATYHLTDALSINAGGRYSVERRQLLFGVQNGAGAFVFPLTSRFTNPEKFTPRASIRYELALSTNIYASYSQGFRSATFNTGSQPRVDLVLPVESETVRAYEVGFKTARRAFSFDVSGFYYDFRNLQVNGAVPDPTCVAQGRPSCPSTNLFTNAPRAETYGVDGQLTIKPVPALTINLGAAWLHARYKDFTTFQGTGLNPVTDTNVTERQDLSGQQMSRSPNFSGNAGFDLELPVAGGGLVLAGNVRYTDSYVISNPSIFGARVAPELRNKQRFRQGAYALLSAQATWTDPSGHISLGVFGNNLTDKTYRMTYNGGTQGDYSVKAEPRTYGVRAGYKF